MLVKVLAESAGMVKSGNWFKVTLGNDYSNKSRVNGVIYLPSGDSEMIVDNGSFCILLGGKSEECEDMKCYSATRRGSSPSFVKYNMDCNNFKDFYVPEKFEGQTLEVILPREGGGRSDVKSLENMTAEELKAEIARLEAA